jgi:hypothetical protein
LEEVLSVEDSEVRGSGFRVLGSGFWVQGSGFRVLGSGFWVQRFWVQRFWVQGSGFKVQGSAPPLAVSVQSNRKRNPEKANNEYRTRNNESTSGGQVSK